MKQFKEPHWEKKEKGNVKKKSDLKNTLFILNFRKKCIPTKDRCMKSEKKKRSEFENNKTPNLKPQT